MRFRYRTSGQMEQTRCQKCGPPRRPVFQDRGSVQAKGGIQHTCRSFGRSVEHGAQAWQAPQAPASLQSRAELVPHQNAQRPTARFRPLPPLIPTYENTYHHQNLGPCHEGACHSVQTRPHPRQPLPGCRPDRSSRVDPRRGQARTQAASEDLDPARKANTVAGLRTGRRATRDSRRRGNVPELRKRGRTHRRARHGVGRLPRALSPEAGHGLLSFTQGPYPQAPPSVTRPQS